MNDQTHNDKAGKTDFDSIYNREDPRAYFRTLAPLKYSSPAHGKRIFLKCAEKITDIRGNAQIDIIDLCCGYGLNGALLKHDMELENLYDRYASEGTTTLASEDLVEADQQHFADAKPGMDVINDIVGIDVAENAVRYAEAVGFVDEGVALNLEEDALPPRIATFAEFTDLITVTGGMGYISGETFKKVLDCAATDEMPWIVTFPLCSVPVDDFVETFEEYGLKVETWDDFAFPQRLYSSETERTRMEAAIAAVGHMDPDELDDNFVPSRLLIARPEADTRKVPLEELIPWDSAPRLKTPLRDAQLQPPKNPGPLRSTKLYC